VGGTVVAVGTTVAVGSIVAVGSTVEVGSIVTVAVGGDGVGVELVSVDGDVAVSAIAAVVGVVPAVGGERVFVRSGSVLSAAQAESSNSRTTNIRDFFITVPNPRR